MSKTFDKITEQTNTLLVVDALNLAFRWKHKGATEFKEDYLSTVESLKKSYKAKHVIITADQGSSSYRKGIYPEYKQNRKDKFEQQTQEEKDYFEMFFQEFNDTLEYIQEETNYTVFRFQGVEADDIGAYIASKRNALGYDHIWLVSSDKDWDLLIDDGVSRFSYVTRKEYTSENWNEYYDFAQEDYISVKCLMGDSGDNVPGVPGVGPKRAAGLVAEYGTCWDIIASIPLSGKQKFVQNLNEFGEQLKLNYELMDLQSFCETAIGEENLQTINTILGI